jgi:hypothetical protein
MIKATRIEGHFRDFFHSAGEDLRIYHEPLEAFL